MLAISDQVFEPLVARNPAALAYRVRWMSRYEAYVAWASQHEADGWTFAFGEDWREYWLPHGGGTMKLVGQLDRIDRNADGQLMVIDYKTTRANSLKTRLKAYEDHQLPFYALLLEPPPIRVAYVAIDDDPDAALEPDDLEQWRTALAEQIGASLTAITQGAGPPAFGTGKSCEWCSMRGLCRKGAW